MSGKTLASGDWGITTTSSPGVSFTSSGTVTAVCGVCSVWPCRCRYVSPPIIITGYTPNMTITNGSSTIVTCDSKGKFPDTERPFRVLAIQHPTEAELDDGAKSVLVTLGMDLCGAVVLPAGELPVTVYPGGIILARDEQAARDKAVRLLPSTITDLDRIEIIVRPF